jgi:UDP-glucose 4-epimerase
MKVNEYQRYIVSGATGVVGYALVNELLSQEKEVYILVRNKSDIKCLESFRHRINIYELDLTDYEATQLALKADVFVHLAWQGTSKTERDDIKIQIDNLKYIESVVRFAKKSGCMKFIGTGSQAEFGNQASPMGNLTIPTPTTAYGIAKSAGFLYTKKMCEELGLHFNWLRIFSLYGKCDKPDTLVEYLRHSYMTNKKVVINNPNTTWDYLPSIFAAKVIIKIADSGLSSKVYSIGSGQAIKLNELLTKLDIAFEVNNKYPGNNLSAKYIVADISDIEKDFGFKIPDIIPDLEKYIKFDQ